MPIIEYMLLALLGSAGAATPGGMPEGPLTRTFTADAVTQPNGGTEADFHLNAGVGLLGQATGGSTDKQAGTGRKGVHRNAARKHYRKGHRHAKLTTRGKKPIKSR